MNERLTEDGLPGVEEEVLEGSQLVTCTKCYLHPARTLTADGTPVNHQELPHPWRVEVSIPGERHWAGNALTFVSKSDAEAYGMDLAMRWTAVRDFRTVDESTPKKEPLT